MLSSSSILQCNLPRFEGEASDNFRRTQLHVPIRVQEASVNTPPILSISTEVRRQALLYLALSAFNLT